MRKILLAVLACLPALLTPAAAGGLPAPKGEVILTVTGKIENTNAQGAAAFDIDMIEGLGMDVSVNKTPWFKERVTFEGPLGKAFLDTVGAKGTKLRFVALNDYAVEVPIEDLRKWPVILATRLEGNRMTVREKGPLFLVYPFDRSPELNSELYYGRSIWQIKSVEVL